MVACGLYDAAIADSRSKLRMQAMNLRQGRPVTSSRPHIILILTDDQGWADAQSLGHPYMKTPAIDRLAAEGRGCSRSIMRHHRCAHPVGLVY